MVVLLNNLIAPSEATEYLTTNDKSFSRPFLWNCKD